MLVPYGKKHRQNFFRKFSLPQKKITILFYIFCVFGSFFINLFRCVVRNNNLCLSIGDKKKRTKPIKTIAEYINTAHVCVYFVLNWLIYSFIFYVVVANFLFCRVKHCFFNFCIYKIFLLPTWNGFPFEMKPNSSYFFFQTNF